MQMRVHGYAQQSKQSERTTAEAVALHRLNMQRSASRSTVCAQPSAVVKVSLWASRRIGSVPNPQRRQRRQGTAVSVAGHRHLACRCCSWHRGCLCHATYAQHRECCLTRRSSGPTTAGHTARTPQWFILHRAGGVARRAGPLSFTLGHAMVNRMVFSRISACRRGLSSHEAAEPRYIATH
jgi:hypothetical protein